MIAKCSLVRVFLKAVPGSVQHNTVVDSITKVPIISCKELKHMKNNLQFTLCTPFRGLAVKSDRSQDREPSRNDITAKSLACKQALHMGYSDICFRIARGIIHTESLFAG